jgi:tagaturonate reductase
MKTDDSIIVLPPIESLPRQTYPVKVLQFGTGNFLRGFADWMIQHGNHKLGLEMGVVAIQSVSNDNTLTNQKGLFTVVERGLVDGEFRSTPQRIDVIQRVVNAQTQFDIFLKEAENPDLQVILSNTTELGIQFDATDGSFSKPATTFPGKLTQLLFWRFQCLADQPLIVLPCELIERNGDRLRECVLNYADHWQLDKPFIDYINRITFCNTLVDRIVPGRASDETNLMHTLGYQDGLITSCEPYHLWAVEAPPWVPEVFPLHKAGVNFIYTDQLEYYRVRKVRILNGAHSIMAPVGYLAGIETVQQSMEHKIIGSFITNCIREEILLTLPGDPMELRPYAEEIIQRFLNPTIRHALMSITLNSFSKWRVRLLPSIKSYYQVKEFVPERISFGLAAQFFLYRGLKGGKDIDLKDDPLIIKEMKHHWQNASFTEKGMEQLAEVLLSNSSWLGEDLSSIGELKEKVGHYLYLIDQIGIVASLEELRKNV